MDLAGEFLKNSANTFGGKTMKWLTPRSPVTLKCTISAHTKSILEHYAKYTGYSEDEVLDQFLKNLLGDPRFASHLRSQRRKKWLISRFFFEDASMSLLDEYASICQGQQENNHSDADLTER